MSPRGWLATTTALAALVTCVACDREGEVKASPAPLARTAPVPEPATTPLNAVAAASGEPIARRLILDSHLIVERDVGVTTRRDGVIERILVERGERVKENQPLATLERGDLLLSEKTAELELEKEQSSFDRARLLSEQKIMSDEDYELARLRRDAAEKNLARTRYELDKCVIQAPFDGVVSGRFVEKGQVIKEDDRRTLFQVTALSPLLARVYVPEWALFGLKEGQRAGVTLTASPVGAETNETHGIEARVRWLNEVLDAASGSAEALVEILGGPGAQRLRPGMSVQVSLDLSFGAGASRAALVSLPREALGAKEPLPGQQLELKVIEHDGSVKPRWVVLGFVGDRRVEVRRGLSAGEKVLLESQ